MTRAKGPARPVTPLPVSSSPLLCSGALCWWSRELATRPSLALELCRARLRERRGETLQDAITSALLPPLGLSAAPMPAQKGRFLLQRPPLHFLQGPGLPCPISAWHGEGTPGWLISPQNKTYPQLWEPTLTPPLPSFLLGCFGVLLVTKSPSLLPTGSDSA